MIIRPEIQDKGIGRSGIQRFSRNQEARIIKGAFKSACKYLKTLYGDKVRAYRVDFTKYKIQIGDNYYPAILNTKSRKFEIEWGRGNIK